MSRLKGNISSGIKTFELQISSWLCKSHRIDPFQSFCTSFCFPLLVKSKRKCRYLHQSSYLSVWNLLPMHCQLEVFFELKIGHQCHYLSQYSLWLSWYSWISFSHFHPLSFWISNQKWDPASILKVLHSMWNTLLSFTEILQSIRLRKVGCMNSTTSTLKSQDVKIQLKEQYYK